jgi:uncharacterized protein YndB with AHSA1/START domain
MSKTSFKVEDDKKTLIVERVFKAPKQKVWEAYTKAEFLEKWWGPRGWETTVKEFDFSEGGEWFYIMKCVDKDQGEWFGKESCGKAVYDNIKPYDSFAYTDYFCDIDGKIDESLPASYTVLSLIENENGETKLVTKTSYDTAKDLEQVLEMGMKEGFEMTLDRLEEFLTS